MSRTYATPQDLVDYLQGDQQPANPGRLLAAASLALDAALIGCHYDTDQDGYPTDPRIRAALRAAVCAQVAYWDELGDATGSGAAARWSSVSIGSVQLAKGAGPVAERGAGELDAPAALQVLRVEGLTPRNPLVYG